MNDLDVLLLLLALKEDIGDGTELLVAATDWHGTSTGLHFGKALIQQGVLTSTQLQWLLDRVEYELSIRNWDRGTALSAITLSLGEGKRRRLWTSLPELAWRTAAVDDGKRYTDGVPFAEGGLGTIWKVREAETGRTVLLKQLKPELSGNSDIVRRFLEEGRITAKLEHPSIVTVYAVFGQTSEHLPFYVMRLAEGRTLEKAIAELHAATRPLSEHRGLQRELIRCLINVCEAIAYAHAHGVIHRDLKPANIIVSRYGGATVLDWGLGKVMRRESGAAGTIVECQVDLDRTQAGQRVGTPLWMAPEQAAGAIEKIDERTDVFGLGATLFSLLTGQPPHANKTGRTPEELFQRIETADAPDCRAVHPNASPALSAICRKAMAPAPQDRYGSAKELVEDLQRWLDGEPVSVYQEPWTRRMARRITRRPARSVYRGGVAVFLLVCAILVFATLAVNRRQVASIEMEQLVKMGASAQEAMASEVEQFQRDVIFIRDLPRIKELVWEGRVTTINEPVSRLLEHFLGQILNYSQLSLISTTGNGVSLMQFTRGADGKVGLKEDPKFGETAVWKSFLEHRRGPAKDAISVWSVVESNSESTPKVEATFMTTSIRADDRNLGYLWLRLNLADPLQRALRIAENQAVVVVKDRSTIVYDRVGTTMGVSSASVLFEQYASDLGTTAEIAQGGQIVRYPEGRIVVVARRLDLSVDPSHSTALFLFANLDEMGVQLNVMIDVLVLTSGVVLAIVLGAAVVSQRILTQIGRPE